MFPNVDKYVKGFRLHLTNILSTTHFQTFHLSVRLVPGFQLKQIKYNSFVNGWWNNQTNPEMDCIYLTEKTFDSVHLIELNNG